MVNWFLGFVAAAVWTTAYGWYFSRDIRRLWHARHRRAIAERQRAEAYAAWMRRPAAPPRSRPAPAPPPPARPPGRSATVIPFPPRDRSKTGA